MTIQIIVFATHNGQACFVFKKPELFRQNIPINIGLNYQALFSNNHKIQVYYYHSERPLYLHF